MTMPSSSDIAYPLDPPALHRMNRILRHRLRNLCAGMKMAVERIAEQTADTHPRLGDRCAIMSNELDNLQAFTERMDLLFDRLPEARSCTLFDLLAALREYFAHAYPLSALKLNGPRADLQLRHGSLLELALCELLLNAGEHAGPEGSVQLYWQLQPTVSFTVVNSTATAATELVVLPPCTFETTRSRHDGMGLSIIHRIAQAIGADLSLSYPDANSLAFTFRCALTETLHE